MKTKLVHASATLAALFCTVRIREVSAEYNPVLGWNGAPGGLCRDSSQRIYPFHAADLKDWSVLDNQFNICSAYCNQHIVTGFVGLAYSRTTFNKLNCMCLFDAAVGLPNVIYSPPSTMNSSPTGTGPIASVYDEALMIDEQCWSYTPTPTVAPTVAQQPGTSIKDFTQVGSTDQGYCVDNTGLQFTRAVSQFHPWSGDQAAAESYCAGWCGQNIDSSFVGMNVAQRKDPITQAASYQCECLFNIPGDDDGFGINFNNLGYTYSPKRRSGYMDDGTGQVAASAKDPNDPTPVTCFKYSPSANTPAPSRAPTAPTPGSSPTPGSKSPTPAPTPPAAAPTPGSKSPTSSAKPTPGSKSPTSSAKPTPGSKSPTPAPTPPAAAPTSKSAKGTKSTKSSKSA